ncbi:MAG: metallophosphoesterase [Nanoarchaeota archaeon]|mgnify:CR=1 FL=1|nr:metallophosphoesterase [Nanoarchaeota archaeon]
MRIFGVSDIHGDRGLVERLLERAKEADVIVLCGDLTFAEESLEGIIGPFKSLGKPILFVPGNHETLATADFLQQLYAPGVYNLHGMGIKIKGVGFFGCGSADIGLFSLTDEEMFETLKQGWEMVKDAEKKVVITHTPPYETKLGELGWVNAGSPGIREFIEEFEPDLCLCGHIHETFGEEDFIGKTRVINVGRTGTMVEI